MTGLFGPTLPRCKKRLYSRNFTGPTKPKKNSTWVWCLIIWAHIAQMPKRQYSPRSFTGPTKSNKNSTWLWPVYLGPHRPDAKKDYTVREASLGPQSKIRFLHDYDACLFGPTPPRCQKRLYSPRSFTGPTKSNKNSTWLWPVYLGPHRPDAKKDYTVREASLGPQSKIRFLHDYDACLFGPTPPRCQKRLYSPRSFTGPTKPNKISSWLWYRFIWAHTAQMPKRLYGRNFTGPTKSNKNSTWLWPVYLGPHRPDAKKTIQSE